MKLTGAETIKLVKLYKTYECIWKIPSAEYKIKPKRQAAYKAIVKLMGKEGFGVPELKQKIKNLRSTYLQELLKIRKSIKSDSGTVNIYVPKIKWFQLMDSFIKDMTIHGQMKDNIDIAEIQVGVHK